MILYLLFDNHIEALAKKYINGHIVVADIFYLQWYRIYSIVPIVIRTKDAYTFKGFKFKLLDLTQNK